MPTDGDRALHLLRPTEGLGRRHRLVEAMHAIKDEFEAYGWRRMQAALRHRGWVVNQKKIKRLSLLQNS